MWMGSIVSREVAYTSCVKVLPVADGLFTSLPHQRKNKPLYSHSTALASSRKQYSES